MDAITLVCESLPLHPEQSWSEGEANRRNGCNAIRFERPAEARFEAGRSNGGN